MGKKACKFYAMVGGAAHAIDAWIENGKIYTIRGLRPFDSAEISENYFYKTDAGGGVYITHSDSWEIAEYCGDIGASFILFEVGKKWGYGNPWSNQIFIAPTYDFAWPFASNDCAVVCKGGVYNDAAHWLGEIGSNLTWDGGGRCGLIDENDTLVIPLKYNVLTHVAFEEDSQDISGGLDIKERHYYIARQGNKRGALDAENRMLIPFVWNDLYQYQYFFLLGEKDVPCASGTRVSYTLFDKDLQVIADDLDELPCVLQRHTFSGVDEDDDSQYYLLRKGQLYGAVRNDGALIAPVELSEADARALLWPLGRAWL